jgi:hypothetical protein
MTHVHVYLLSRQLDEHARRMSVVSTSDSDFDYADAAASDARETALAAGVQLVGLGGGGAGALQEENREIDIFRIQVREGFL